MADLSTDFVGITSPNPFWLASAPPTDKKYNVERAFRAGWGGVVWKTLGEAGPPIVNVNGPRYGAVWGADRRLLGLNNIELITDRPLEVNLREIKEVKRDWPDRAMVVSLMVPCTEDAWKAILPLVEETGADGIELNFGCPHGMSERGMGSAVGQVPEYIEMVTRWCKANTRMPVIVKLTPNITDIRYPASCIKCGRCYAACEDTSHQAISMSPERVFEVIDAECVACNLCVNVCPVEDCITMERLPAGATDLRTGLTVTDTPADWTQHPNNPAARAAE
jgi:dihydropyrimidine dehydrogenase (NAD+) subunit PreA